jgi:acyl-CoA reductase-like NAD-dependent aldehyde dehydrogenase
VLNPPSNWSLHHSEPFGPVNSIIIVDTEAELLAAMNASNGCLVASVATSSSKRSPREQPLYGNLPTHSRCPRT